MFIDTTLWREIFHFNSQEKNVNFSEALYGFFLECLEWSLVNGYDSNAVVTFLIQYHSIFCNWHFSKWFLPIKCFEIRYSKESELKSSYKI